VDPLRGLNGGLGVELGYLRVNIMVEQRLMTGSRH
jgi:hypothetical protein